MTDRALFRRAESSLAAAGSVAAAIGLLSLAVWTGASAAPAAGTPEEAALKRDFQSCHVHANVDACYDAIRWNPADPQLLVALGDALERARHTSDAIRAYRRAAALAPNMGGVAEKISAAEAKLASEHASKNGSHSPSSRGDSNKRYSNAAPEAQSH
jgi:cytochrome c-type biogenesis protein CcmH/NrfG